VERSRSYDPASCTSAWHFPLHRGWYIRGAETYRDPDRGGTVKLPSGYNNAWYNGSTNEYIVTESQLYNPNVEARGDWTKLEKRE
jgi:hypothetical protein